MTDIHFRTHCGYEIDGESLVVTIEPHHLNAGGIVHGGLIATMLDHSGGMPLHMNELDPWVTLNMNVNYLGMGKLGDTLRTTTKIIRKGASVAVVNVEMHNQNNKLIATATTTYKSIKRK